jgi:ABC-type Fe3+/spermidine/putrescine transport system ATPase subunit
MACGTICTHGVTKRFGDVAAVLESELCVERGEFVALLGPSGCGKTTWLRLVAGFERPDAGEIAIEDRPVFGPGVFVPAHARGIGMVFQEYALFPHLSVEQNVGFGVRRGERRERVPELLRLVGLTQYAHRFPHELSGGQQQRVALARALVMEPKVLLLDEPLGALDLKVRKELQIELKRIQHEVGITFVYVTHDQEEALAMSDRVAVMNAGRVEQLGRPREIYDRPATRFVADFIGETNFIDKDGDTVAVRPEQVQLARTGASDNGALAGVVVTTMVIGPAIQCLVRTDNGQEVLVRQQRSGREEGVESLREGDRVTVTWAEGAALTLDHAKEETGR